jgi:hypothetical protein
LWAAKRRFAVAFEWNPECRPELETEPESGSEFAPDGRLEVEMLLSWVLAWIESALQWLMLNCGRRKHPFPSG